jgi:ribosomal protein S18 acetylase RimI-like enzyme
MTSESLIIRPAQESDKPMIWQLFIEMMRPRLTAKTPDREWAFHHIQGHLNHKKEIFLLALKGDNPVGATLARLSTNKRASIFGAYVIPSFRQKGIMRAIGERLEKELREIGISEIDFQVQAENKAGRKVLEALGFKARLIDYRKDLR